MITRSGWNRCSMARKASLKASRWYRADCRACSQARDVKGFAADARIHVNVSASTFGELPRQAHHSLAVTPRKILGCRARGPYATKHSGQIFVPIQCVKNALQPLRVFGVSFSGIVGQEGRIVNELDRHR